MLSPKFIFQAEIGRMGDLVVWEVTHCADMLLLLQIPLFSAPRVQPAVKYHRSTGHEELATDPRYKSKDKRKSEMLSQPCSSTADSCAIRLLWEVICFHRFSLSLENEIAPKGHNGNHNRNHPKNSQPTRKYSSLASCLAYMSLVIALQVIGGLKRCSASSVQSAVEFPFKWRAGRKEDLNLQLTGLEIFYLQWWTCNVFPSCFLNFSDLHALLLKEMSATRVQLSSSAYTKKKSSRTSLRSDNYSIINSFWPESDLIRLCCNETNWEQPLREVQDTHSAHAYSKGYTCIHFPGNISDDSALC